MALRALVCFVRETQWFKAKCAHASRLTPVALRCEKLSPTTRKPPVLLRPMHSIRDVSLYSFLVTISHSRRTIILAQILQCVSVYDKTLSLRIYSATGLVRVVCWWTITHCVLAAFTYLANKYTGVLYSPITVSFDNYLILSARLSQCLSGSGKSFCVASSSRCIGSITILSSL